MFVLFVENLVGKDNHGSMDTVQELGALRMCR
jgi:hypothetical protein